MTITKTIKDTTRDYYRKRYFLTLQEYFKKYDIIDANIQKLIKLELLEIEKEEEQKNQLIDKLLQCMRAFKFIESGNKNNYMIYSPCSKQKGYQLTFFHNNEPYSDIYRESIPSIKDEIMSYINRYNQLDLAIGKLV